MNSFRKKMYPRILLFTIGVVFILVGCAPPEIPDVVWPLPPDEPRIKFERTFSGKQSFLRSSGLSVTDIVLGPEGGGKFNKPHGVYIDENDVVYVSDTALGAIHVFDQRGQKYQIFGGVSKPIGIATDGEGKIFVADSKIKKIMVFTKDGKFFTAIGKEGEFKNPAGIVINRELERIYVVDSQRHNIVALSLLDGSRLFTIGKRGTGEGQFNFPSQITIDRETGNLWVVDTLNGRVQILDADGRYLFEFGRLGDAPGSFSRPKGIGFDNEGHVYVVDAGSNNVQVFNNEGYPLMAFSGYGGADLGTMILPAGIAIDSNDLIYVADQWNARISVFQFLSERYKREHPEVMKRLRKGLNKPLQQEK